MDTSLKQLRDEWAEHWGQTPHQRIGRIMLEKSLAYKKSESLTRQQKDKLKQLVSAYKQNPGQFQKRQNTLKPGVRLVRTYQGKSHTVLVTKIGFDYQGQHYTSLSQIANHITGKRWNGWIFFGLKKATAA